MQEDRSKKVEERAHGIWESEGRPDGKHDEHWKRAEQEVSEGENGLGASEAGSVGASNGSEKKRRQSKA
jgi:hypothetical protein